MSKSEQSSQQNTIALQVIALENTRYQIVVQDDIEAYEKLLADDLVYIHSTGKIDNKESFLASRYKSKNRFVSFEPSGVQVRVYNSTTAIITGRTRNVQRAAEGLKVVHNSFTSIWTRDSEHSQDWRFTSYQQSRIADSGE